MDLRRSLRSSSLRCSHPGSNWEASTRPRCGIDRLKREDLLLRGVHIDLRDVSMLHFLRGDLQSEIRAGSLRSEVPKDSTNEYLLEHTLGFRGEINILPGFVDRGSRALFELPINFNQSLWVAGSHTIEVIPEEAMVGSFFLSSFFTRSFASGDRIFDLGELPVGTKLGSVEPSEEETMEGRVEKQELQRERLHGWWAVCGEQRGVRIVLGS
jgi:hypothetical protein